MAGALITIDQVATPAGVPGASREDLDLFGGANPITLTNDDDVGVVSWTWTLIDRPNGSAAALAGAATPTATLNADIAGSYLIRLVTVDGAGSVYQDEIVAAVTLANGWRIPAAFEMTQFNATRGWAEELDEILRDIAAGGALFVPLQSAYDDGAAIVTTLAGGPAAFSRGATAAVGDALLTLADANLAPGRTAALVSVVDSNVVGAGPPATVAISRVAAGYALDVTGDAHVSGKLTVDGAIDPTALLLDAGVPADAFFDSASGLNAAVSAVGHGRLAYDETQAGGSGRWMSSTEGNAYERLAVFSEIPAPGATDLQTAYDGGSTILTTLADGDVEIERGSPGVAVRGVYVHDDNNEPGRTASLFEVEDANVGATGPSLTAQRSVTGGPVVRLADSQATTAPALQGPTLEMYASKGAVGVDEDGLGRIDFYGPSAAGAKTAYASLAASIRESNGASNTEGYLDFATFVQGNRERLFSLHAATAGVTESGAVFTSRTNVTDVDFTFRTTHDDANGAVVALYADSASEAANDIVGSLRFDGNDNAFVAQRTTYAQVDGIALDVADGGEDGALIFRAVVAGTMRESVRVFSNAGSSAVFQSTKTMTAGTAAFFFTQTDDSASDEFIIFVEDNATSPGAGATLMTLSGIGKLSIANDIACTNVLASNILVSSTTVINSVAAASFYSASTQRATGGSPGWTLYTPVTGGDDSGTDSPSLRLQGTVVGEALRNIDILNEADVGTDTYRLRINDNGGAVIGTFAAGATDLYYANNGAAGPVLALHHTRTNDGAISDEAGKIQFWAMDDGAPAEQQYGEILCAITNPAAGTEYGGLDLRAVVGGVMTSFMAMIGSSVGSPSRIGFFGATPVGPQAAATPTAAEIKAGLVALGLFTA